MPLNRVQFRLSSPKIVAIAKDSYLTPTNPFPDNLNMPGIPAPRYGQDFTSAYGRSAPGKQDVGNTPGILKPKMRKLLAIFASGDNAGMATRLFNAFLTDTCREVQYFDDPSMNIAAASHPNIASFCDAALSAPTPN